ncbi:MAG TPA: CarD family transcriptional regulator [Rickettsiales bacterium]|nr:CarD family transcriptional regulator [Rickettsiales bacterium]
MSKNLEFKVGDYCFYRAHGIAMVKQIKIVELDGFKNKCLVLFLSDTKLTLTLPVNDKLQNSGIRKLSTKIEIEEAFSILSNGLKKVKGMWARRAKEYEEKINSGDIIAIAEVIRDLTRDVEDAERSFSERMIYETAINRLASEYAVIVNIEFQEAIDKIKEVSKQRIKFVDIEQCNTDIEELDNKKDQKA